MNQANAVLLFGAFIIAAEIAVVIFHGRGLDSQSVRLIGLSLVVIAAIFLPVCGVDRLGAAYALLGVMAGYLVARYEIRPQKSDRSDDD